MTRKRSPATSIGSQTEAVTTGFPEPPETSPMRAEDRPFWDSIVRARLPQEWARVDLVHAAQLARTMADMEANRALLLAEGDMITNSKTGAAKLNPRHALQAELSRRSLQLTRVLQLHARAVLGKTEDLGIRKGEAMKASEVLDRPKDDDGLLARPMMQ